MFKLEYNTSLHMYLLGPSAAKRLRMLDFDPRAVGDRSINEAVLKENVKQLANMVPDTCLRLMWGVHPPPPNFDNEVEIESKPSLEQQAQRLVMQAGLVSLELLLGPLDSELVEFIDEFTHEQDKCTLWHELHIGRLTSSNFGQIFRTKNSPSLLQSIVHRK